MKKLGRCAMSAIAVLLTLCASWSWADDKSSPIEDLKSTDPVVRVKAAKLL